ncbi:MAG: spore coat U domain-containing protein [Hyphomonadaceae bacterium]|nr:spore coat U domain-containing protein [Hyphomonadaceae bacterium]
MRTAHFLATLTVAVCATGAWADDDTDTFTVSATVLATCEVIANDLAFGSYDPVAAAHLDASTTLSVTCTNGTGYNVRLNLGEGAGASTATRFMDNGAQTLGYTLYRNAGRTQLWGTTIGSDTLAGAGTGAPATITVYGRIPMQQAVPSGTYDDTVTVTVTW